MITLQTYWDILSREIVEYNAALIIQQRAVKMFYKRYGKKWKEEIENYEDRLDYFCYLNDINDPWQDYIEYYR